MTRDQYIDSLISQGLSKEQIKIKLKEFDLQTDPPKKPTDPLKQETNMGSNNMVSKLDDGSLESQSPSADFFTSFKDFLLDDQDEKIKEAADKRKELYNLNEEEQEVFELRKSVDAGEIGGLNEKLEKIPSKIEALFEIKEKKVGYSGIGGGFSQQSISYESRDDRAEEAIKKAKKEILRKRVPTQPMSFDYQVDEEAVINLAKQNLTKELEIEARESAYDEVAEEYDKGKREVVGSIGFLKVTESAGRNKIKRAMQSINKKQKETLEDVKKSYFSQAQSAYTLNTLIDKNGKDTSKWSKEDLEEYKKEYKYFKEDAIELNQKVSDIQANSEYFKPFEQELDSFKREYGLVTETMGNVSAATLELAGGLAYAGELIYDIGQSLQVVPNSYELTEKDIEKKSLLANTGDKLFKEAEKIRGGIARPAKFEDIDSVSSFADWAYSGLINNSPQLALTLSTAGSTSGLFAIGGIAAGQKYKETLDLDKSQFDRYSSAILAMAIEMGSEKITQNLFLRSMGGGKIAKSAFKEASAEVRNISKIKNLFNTLPRLTVAQAEGFIEEGGSEALAQIGNNLVDKYALEKENVNIFDGVAESALMGGIIGTAITTVPNIGAHVIAPFTANKNLKALTERINGLGKQLDETDNLKAKEAIATQIKKAQTEIDKIVVGGVETLMGLDSSDVKRAHEIFDEQKRLKEESKSISKDKSTPANQKAFLLEQLENSFNELEQERVGIVEKGNKAVRAANTTVKRISGVLDIVSDFSDIDVRVASNSKEATEIAEELDPENAENNINNDGYIISNPITGKQTIVINADVAVQNEAVNVAGHELLHGILFSAFRKSGILSDENLKGLSEELKNKLKEINPSALEKGEFADRLKMYQEDAQLNKQINEETLTLFFDAYAKGLINLNETARQSMGDRFRNVFRRAGFGKIKFDTGEDVINFIKDFDRSVQRGKLTRAQRVLAQKGVEGKLIPEQEKGRIVQLDGVEEFRIAASSTEKPKAIFMVGGPGAGKTNVGKGLKLGRRGFKVVNQDIALEAMKEEAGLPAEEAGYTAEQRSLRSKLGAAAVKAAKEKFNQYVSNRNDMVIDGTGASYNATMKKVKELQDAGFDVSMVVANTPLQTALDRNRARKERSLPDNIVTKTYEQVQESLAKYKQDFGNKLYEINTEAIEYGKDLPQDFLDEVYTGVGVDQRRVMYSKSTVLEEINDLVPDNVTTKEDFANPRVFDKIYEATAFPGGVINNYIRSRTSSIEEAEAATDSVVDRLMAFDPQAKRADGSTVGIEGFGEFIFANTAFGKLDAKKKLFEESQRKAQETRIDESTKQIADVEEQVFTQEEVGIKEKPTINPLRFTGVPETIALSKKPEGKPTFKTITKQYAGEVGEQAIGIPAKKITESAANLGSVNEARAIQQFFFKADNLDKFVKILPEFNIALPETQIGLETLDAPRDVKGTGLGLPKRILDYFYEDFIDPTGKLTSPKGRSKGLTSQVPVKRLKPEFRGVVAKETIDKIKSDIGITPKGELNILPKGELRSPIGQLLKGMAKTYSSLAANTLVRQEMGASNFAKEDIARAAAGKQRVMASITGTKKIENVEGLDLDIMLAMSGAKDINEAAKKLGIENKITVNESNRAEKLDQANVLIEKGKITTAQLEAAKPFNFGRLYENRDGVKYYKLKDGSFVKRGTKQYKEAEKQGLFVAARGSLYYGKSDPAYKKAFALAQVNDESLNIPKAKRVSAKKAFSDKADDQFKINLDVLQGLAESLADAVHLHGVPIETAALFITSSYQATTGIIKISGEFKYESDNAEYAGPKGKPNQNTGEKFIEEHSVPASTVGAVLIYGIKANAVKPVMEVIRNSFIQVKLGKQYDMLVDKAGLASKLPDGYSIMDNNAIRYLMAGMLTKDMPDLPSMDMNAQVNPKTGKTWAQELGIDLPKANRTKENIDLQNELLLDLLTNGGKFSNHQAYLNESIKINTDEAAKANASKSPAIVKASKSNKQLLNNLNNYDKALRNARNPKAPVKGISVFDFDDTLATTKSMVGVTMPDGTETKIDATEFAKTGEDLLEQGATFDFSDFSKVVDGEPGPLIAKLDKAIKKFGNKDVFILTARPANSASAIYEFLKGLGYEIPLENITGLANSSPEAKAQWMVDKAAEGYNDFYFTDDAYKNVKAVQDAMKVLDVKSKERMVYKDRYDKLDKEMNDILEAKTGIAAEKEYSKAKAEVVGAGKGRFKFFIPPSADDFVGLLYSTLAKGKLGDNQMAWYKKNLIDPYARAMNNISSERVALAADYKALKKQLGIVPKNLRKKIKGEGFTKEQAVRMYIWNKQGMNIPGLSKTDLEDMVKFVENDASLQVFADQLIEINKGDGYPAPKEYWLSGSITTDLMDGLGGTKRAKHLEEWQQNVDVIFSEKNLNKMEAAYGRPYREAMENMLERMKSGKNRNYNGDSTTGRMLDWLNGSIGAIMFLNTRSAVLQTLSAVNFINFKDNNILAAGKAFANQKQYWKDFKELFNSDFLKERREGMNINVNEADIADMAKRGGAKGAISYLLQLGFTPTQIADSFAIASGGATFYRNRIKSYVKQGLSETEAKEKAFLDFRETAEESQQSSRPDRISKQQAGPLGRVVLAFANTPSQYARIMKKAGQDLAARRGDAVTNISKLIYYGAVQGFIFNAIQQALFAADMEDEEEMEEKTIRLANGMADGVLRGMGVSGAATAVVKNAALRVYNESQKDRPKYEKVAFELTKLSPPISSKLSRINQAAREVQWNSDEMKQKGFSLDNPAWLAAGNVISATTNVPVDRAIKKVNNVKDAFDQDLAMYERAALLSGWQAWELGIEDEKDKKEKKSNSPRTYNRKSSTPGRIDRRRSIRIKR